MLHCWLQVRTFSYGGTPVTLKEGALGDGVGAKVWTVAHIVCRWVDVDWLAGSLAGWLAGWLGWAAGVLRSCAMAERVQPPRGVLF